MYSCFSHVKYDFLVTSLVNIRPNYSTVTSTNSSYTVKIHRYYVTLLVLLLRTIIGLVFLVLPVLELKKHARVLTPVSYTHLPVDMKHNSAAITLLLRGCVIKVSHKIERFEKC